ncbi:ROK family protein [Paenibacillus frigoriresistens]|uniref:ROK family protein n=1 Tax=Paenibacillus alginolyticus TaxID=59839 RepID=UPI001567130B|nr:ROK family protein [Paenibacillus frigoriresistens]NRF95729.1 ROK family protein [Paenibacillus frigoriresistens]
MADNTSYALGIDLGGTKLLTALIRNDGYVIDTIEHRTVVHQGETALKEQLQTSVRELMQQVSISEERLCGFGVATAGVIDMKKAEIVFANNIGIRNAPIGTWLQEVCSLPVFLGNDANVAAVGEWLYGAGSGCRNVIYVTVSTGIGSGIIVDGKLITGAGDSAGEFGHISVDLMGPPCPCGGRGCLEIYASGTALSQFIVKRMEEGEHSAYLQPYFPAISSREIAQAAQQGDRLALQAFARIGYYLGAGLSNLIHILNPERIVLGGGVMQAAEYFMPTVERTLDELCIPKIRSQVQLSRSTLGAQAGIKGAAGLVFSQCID